MLSSFGFWDQGGGALPLVSPGPSCVMDGPADTSDGAPVVCLGGSNNCGTNYAGYLAGGRYPMASDGVARMAVCETVILLHPPLPLVGISIGIKRGCHQNDSLANG